MLTWILGFSMFASVLDGGLGGGDSSTELERMAGTGVGQQPTRSLLASGCSSLVH